MRLLREQLEEAWSVNEHLVERIEELKSRLARYEKPKGQVGDHSTGATHLHTHDMPRQSARVFRWPKQPSNKRVIKIRDKVSDFDDEVITTPVRTVYRSAKPLDSSSSSDSGYSSPNRQNMTVPDILDDTIMSKFDSNTELNTTPTSKLQHRNATPAKISKPTIPNISPVPKPIRVEATSTGVRVSTRSSRPSSRRRIVKAVLPDETTVNQSGVISDSPARAKRQMFRI